MFTKSLVSTNFTTPAHSTPNTVASTECLCLEVHTRMYKIIFRYVQNVQHMYKDINNYNLLILLYFIIFI